MKRSEKAKAGPKFRVALSKPEAERLVQLLRVDGHDYLYAQAGCVLCKLHERLVDATAQSGQRQRKGKG